MGEEPEQVLPEQRVAALGRVEEVRADRASCRSIASIVLQSMTAGMAKMIMNDGHDLRPDEQRDAVERHARGALLEDRGDDLDRRRPAC